MKYTKDQLAAAANFYKEHLKNPPPEMRNILLYLAKDAFDNKNVENSVYFQTQALCNSFETKNIFKTNNLNIYTDICLRDAIFPKSYTKTKHSNALLNFAKENFSKEVEYTTVKNIEEQFNIKEKIFEEKNFLNNLPREWTILQLTKDFNENMSLQSREKNLNLKLPIYLTILKHSRNHVLDNFICIKIEFNGANLYNAFFEIQELFKSLSNENRNEENILEYHKKISPLENKIISGIQKLEEELGPWVCLFSGNLKNENIQLEIYKNVDNFCKKHKLENNIKIILSLLLNAPEKLTPENCKIASEYLYKGKNKKLNNLLEEFLIKTVDDLSNEENLLEMKSKNPCLLIIDELLDHFPWEFLNKPQEFCRLSSLNILQQIFNKHKSKIIDGYLRTNVKMGHFLVNPQNNLKSTESRFRSFGKYWLPNFNYLFGEQPSHEQVKEIFNSHDIYVYCGHGHGMDYLNPHKLGISEIANPVVFLFGCESVKLTSKTNYGEMTGQHLYFHKGLCPAVVGCIHVAFDFSLDMIATEILSTWIPSNQKISWSNIDTELWRKGKIQQTKKVVKNLKSQYNSRLAAILSNIREKGAQKYYHLIPLVYRGIPVWNNNVNEMTD